MAQLYQLILVGFNQVVLQLHNLMVLLIMQISPVLALMSATNTHVPLYGLQWVIMEQLLLVLVIQVLGLWPMLCQQHKI